MSELIHKPDYWEEAKRALSAKDPIMAGVIASYPNEIMQSRGDAFYTLARSIVGQQISVKAAESVWVRFEALMGEITPTILKMQTEDGLRACGLSRQKVLYLNEIADYFIKNHVTEAYFEPMNDSEAIKALTSIKGIGVWTAEMFLMFHLMRPNVLPLDDIGLQRGIERHYKKGKKTTRKQHILISNRWSPWRTVATWYLWRSLDPVPVEY